MNTDIILRQCIVQAEQLMSKINSNSDLPAGCLGGNMKPTYEKVRAYQANLTKKILQQLQDLLTNN